MRTDQCELEVTTHVLFLFFTDPPRAFSSSVAALAAVVRQAGDRASALEVVRTERIDDVAERVDSIAPDVLAVSVMSRDWPGASALLERISSTPLVVVGGYHASLAADEVARHPRVDAICIGEGERPLRRMLQRVAQGEALVTEPGLWARTDRGWTEPKPGADPEPDIAALPWWDYEVFGPVSRALRDGVNTFGPHADGYLPTRAGRGCPYTCSYCSAPRWGKLQGYGAPDRRNTRPVSELCNELSSLRDRYSPEGFEFWDEHFPIHIDWLEELAAEYPKRVGLPFKVEMHPSAATRKRLELLVRAGCSLFHCGIEAGDETFRKEVLNRRTADATLQRVFDDCRELGLETSASLMTMLPGETRQQMHSTTSLVKRLQPGSFMWSNYHPLPGTVLGDASVAEWPGNARETFDDYDDVVMRTPPSVDDEERAATFRELRDLQVDLVELATRREGGKGAALRARPVEVPVPERPPPARFAALLGLAPPDGPAARPRVKLAAFEHGVVTIRIEHPAFDSREIRLAARDGSPSFVETKHLALSYGGREAPESLLRLLTGIARRLENSSLEDLRRALE